MSVSRIDWLHGKLFYIQFKEKKNLRLLYVQLCGHQVRKNLLKCSRFDQCKASILIWFCNAEVTYGSGVGAGCPTQGESALQLRRELNTSTHFIPHTSRAMDKMGIEAPNEKIRPGRAR
jgi:hypothetical protein